MSFETLESALEYAERIGESSVIMEKETPYHGRFHVIIMSEDHYISQGYIPRARVTWKPEVTIL